MQPSIFTRVAAVEAELQSVKDALDQMLDILAEMKANQDEMRRERDESGGVAPASMDPSFPRRWRMRQGVIARMRALRRIGVSRIMRVGSLAEHDEAATDHDDHAYWKVMARSAIAGLFLLTVFMIGLYRLLKQG